MCWKENAKAQQQEYHREESCAPLGNGRTQRAMVSQPVGEETPRGGHEEEDQDEDGAITPWPVREERQIDADVVPSAGNGQSCDPQYLRMPQWLRGRRHVRFF